MGIKRNSIFLSILCSGFLLGQEVFDYQTIDKKPVFPGCENETGQELDRCNNKAAQIEMMRYLEYPDSSIENGETGTAYIKFLVTEEGKIENTEVLRSSKYPTLDQAAVEAVSLLFHGNTILPGHKDGYPVKVSYVVPVKFKMEIEEPVETPTSVITEELSTEDVLDRLEQLKSPDFDNEEVKAFSDQYIRFVKGIITGFYLKDGQVIDDWELFFKKNKLDEGPNSSMLSERDQTNLNLLFEEISNIKRSIH